MRSWICLARVLWSTLERFDGSVSFVAVAFAVVPVRMWIFIAPTEVRVGLADAGLCHHGERQVECIDTAHLGSLTKPPCR